MPEHRHPEIGARVRRFAAHRRAPDAPRGTSLSSPRRALGFDWTVHTLMRQFEFSLRRRDVIGELAAATMAMPNVERRLNLGEHRQGRGCRREISTA